MSGRSISAVDRAVEGIKFGIRSGKYSPGQRLIEIDLAADLNVSRNTLRDGIQRLVAEGLVQVERYKGASVRKMSKSELIELTLIRATLEGLAASVAAAQSISARRKAFDAIRDRCSPEVMTSVESFRDYNSAFHDMIVRLSGLANLPSFIDMTKLAMVRLHFDTILLQPQRMKMSMKEHQMIEDAILSGRPQEAEAAMRMHVGHTRDIILSAPDQFFSE